MWPLPIPDDQVHETYRICIREIKDQDVKVRLEAAEAHVIWATVRFESAARSVSLHTLDPKEFGPASPEARKEMQDVYSNRLVRKDTAGRQIYDRLKLAAPWCPLCGHRNVETLDHHLPKKLFSYLSVS